MQKFCRKQKARPIFAFFCQLPGCMFNHSQATMNSILIFLPFLQNLDVRRKKYFLGQSNLEIFTYAEMLPQTKFSSPMVWPLALDFISVYQKKKKSNY